MRSLLTAALLTLLLASPGADGRWDWPLEPRPQVRRGFEAPPGPYAPGHRGVDLVTSPGAPVRAVADGVVAFAGTVAGVAVVSVDHGEVRSTYQPVAALVTRGTHVRQGEVVGRAVLAGSHCFPRACLHLGRRVGTTYTDPLMALRSGSAVRLVNPSGPPPTPPPVVPGGWDPGDGPLGRPVAGPVTSPYGMRMHPVRHVLALHDGIDLGAPCGTPVRAAAAGRVLAATYDPAYGNRVVVDHGGGLVTTYNHLASTAVAPPARIAAGTVVGAVGSTGLSTGCHLHFMVVVDGEPTDPAASW